jgi:quercetin dioxygenase-like cupin family protein
MPLFVQTADVEWDDSYPTASALYVAGQRLSISMNRVRPGHDSPPETHPEEQVNIVLQGTMEIVLGEDQKDVYVCGPDSVLFIEPNMPHATRVVGEDEVIVVSAFSPCRHRDKAISTSDWATP